MSSDIETEKIALCVEYTARQAVVKKLEAGIESEREILSTLARKILHTYGKGPHMIEGKQVFVYHNRGTYFFGLQRGRGNKATV